MTPQNEDSLLIRVVDDDDVLRDSLGFLLRAEGWQVETYASAQAFLASDRPSLPGCLVLDVRMPEMSGLQLQQELNRRGVQLPIIFLTGHGDMQMAVNAMKQGAVDFVSKPIDPELFVQAIRNAVRKQELRARGVESIAEACARYRQLTDREKDICRFLARGLLNREVGSRLCISERTVEGHRASAFRKLGIRTVKDLALLLDQIQQA
ncbi:MAG: response regulator transcription factor [Duodenibacillus sp.]|nr:response regulator transcription factor [Duodenibacillus sp.]